VDLCVEVPSFGEVLLFLLLSDFDLLIFSASPEFIAPELVLALVRLATMFWNEASCVTHDETNERKIEDWKTCLLRRRCCSEGSAIVPKGKEAEE
jgi:hypothetical protein